MIGAATGAAGGALTGRSAACAPPPASNAAAAMVPSQSLFMTMSPRSLSTYIANQAWRNRVLLALAPAVVPLNLLYQVYCRPMRALNHAHPGAELVPNGM